MISKKKQRRSEEEGREEEALPMDCTDWEDCGGGEEGTEGGSGLAREEIWPYMATRLV